MNRLHSPIRTLLFSFLIVEKKEILKQTNNVRVVPVSNNILYFPLGTKKGLVRVAPGEIVLDPFVKKVSPSLDFLARRLVSLIIWIPER